MELRSLRRGELYKILPTHPGVERYLKRSVECTGFMTTGFSFKKHREGRLATCKKPARWTFRPLRRFYHERDKPVPTEHLCWAHLLYRGVWGSMEEEARTWRWLDQLGYRTPNTDPDYYVYEDEESRKR